MKYQRRIRKHRYLHVADELRDGILSARWRPGDLLPSESQLCREFGVSRGTVVKAIEVLLADGLAHRRQGVGTFVSRPSLHRMPGFLIGFSETVRQQGRTPSHRLVSQQKLSRSEALTYGCDEPALLMQRVRLVDGVPWAIHNVIVPQAVAAKVPALSGGDASVEDASFSLYDSFGAAGIAISHADEAVNARLATEEEARLLDIDRPSAVMLVHRRSFDTDERLIELIEAIYLGECYTYEIRLVRGHGVSSVQSSRPLDSSGSPLNVDAKRN